MRQRTDAMAGSLHDAVEPARPGAGKTVREIEMSKGSRGNKEAKKPKKVTPVVKSPGTGTDAPTLPNGSKPVLQKR